jgi:hypothetical protein
MISAIGDAEERQSGNAQVIHRLLKAQAVIPSKKGATRLGIALLGRERDVVTSNRSIDI